MAKKRKPNEYQQQKIAKAQHKNLFLFKMRGIINISCEKCIYEHIPQKYLDDAYENRNLSVLIIPAEGHNIPKEQFKEMISLFSISLKEIYIPFTPDDRLMSLNDFFTVCLSINNLERTIKYGDFLMARVVKDELKKITENDKLVKTGLAKLAELLRAVGIQYSDLQKQLYYFNLKVKIIEENGIHIQHRILVYCQKPEIAYVNINKEYRPVIRFGLVEEYSGIKWLSIKPSQLDLKNTFADLPHDIYIQSHALIRLKERLDCMEDQFILFTLYQSLKYSPKLCYDKHKHMMLEYRIVDEKLGYLPIEITDGKIVIKTFLFVTNNVTPEGMMLEKYTGFQKEEEKYLSIDKLSTFVNSDIGENIELQKFLRKSGCQSLIDLHQKHKEVLNIENKTNSLSKMMELMVKNMDYQNKEMNLEIEKDY